MKSYVFGPVPSRRLGRSLGIDLVPFKTCTYDCIYCQLGRTTRKTVERKEWFPLEDVLLQVRGKLSTEPDYITLSGSGEPTLYSRIGELIAGIKETTDVPVAVLTNGSLLGDPHVRAALIDADLVVPSLDAGGDRLFQCVNRPVAGFSFDRLLEGLFRFRYDYSGLYWLEVFLMGVNTTTRELEKLAALARQINPDKVQLNTVTRPPAEEYASPVSEDLLRQYAEMFGPGAEVIADYRGNHRQKQFKVRREDIIDLLQRRPCSVEDIAEGLGMHRNEVVKHVSEMEKEGILEYELCNGIIYYSCGSDHGGVGKETAGRDGIGYSSLRYRRNADK